MLTLQLAFSEIDTTKLIYPRIAYPNEITQDTCVQFTLEQAKQAAVDGINADYYKAEVDSYKVVTNDLKELNNQKLYEIKQLNLSINARQEIIDNLGKKSNKYEDLYNKSEKKLQFNKKIDSIVYPTLGVAVLTTILYIIVDSALNK